MERDVNCVWFWMRWLGWNVLGEDDSEGRWPKLRVLKHKRSAAYLVSRLFFKLLFLFHCSDTASSHNSTHLLYICSLGINFYWLYFQNFVSNCRKKSLLKVISVPDSRRKRLVCFVARQETTCGYVIIPVKWEFFFLVKYFLLFFVNKFKILYYTFFIMLLFKVCIICAA